MDFKENGSKFNENIIINKEKGYLIYDVPQHNKIMAARFLRDFKAVSFNVSLSQSKLYFIISQHVVLAYTCANLEVRQN